MPMETKQVPLADRSSSRGLYSDDRTTYHRMAEKRRKLAMRRTTIKELSIPMVTKQVRERRVKQAPAAESLADTFAHLRRAGSGHFTQILQSVIFGG
jgi:hypothetical protein